MSSSGGFMKWVTVIFLSLAALSCVKEKSVSNEDRQIKPLVEYSTAVFAGGCFWCVESDFEKYPGVVDAVSGYTGGKTTNPTYEEVSYKETGHYEAVKVHFDESVVSYSDLLEIFWRSVDPTDAGGQFVDRGNSYRTAIFYADEEQLKAVTASVAKLKKSRRYQNKKIITPFIKASTFYKAEGYHQDYYKKKPTKYKYYRFRSGRDQYLKKIWGEDLKYKVDHKLKNTAAVDKSVLKKTLTKMQYHVTQEGGTEPPFKNEFWDNKASGIYVDVVSGEPLFSSLDKYKSGTGWPSFTKPLESKNIVEKIDKTLFATRTEVRSKNADSHLGHVFNDGPKPLGLRYCLNSASLRFISVEDLEKAGLSKYLKLFK